MKKRTVFLTIGVVLVLIVALLFLIVLNWMFSVPAPYDFLAVEWDVEDALAFYGSYLSFLGTIVLGAVTVYQTNKAYKLSQKSNDQTDVANELSREAIKQAEKAHELSLQMHKLEQARFYSVVSLERLMIQERSVDVPNYINTQIREPKVFDLVDTNSVSKCFRCYHVDFIVKNESEFPISSITVNCHGRFEDVNYGIKEDSETIYIAPNNTHNIRLIIPATYFVKYNEYIADIDIFYQNIFGYETHVRLIIDDISDEHNPKYTYQFQRVKEINS